MHIPKTTELQVLSNGRVFVRHFTRALSASLLCRARDCVAEFARANQRRPRAIELSRTLQIDWTLARHILQDL